MPLTTTAGRCYLGNMALPVLWLSTLYIYRCNAYFSLVADDVCWCAHESFVFSKMRIFAPVFALLFVIKLWRCSHKTPLEYLRSRYGLNTLKTFRTWEQSLKKCKKCALDLEFLETCKAYEITPKFVRFKLHKKACIPPTSTNHGNSNYLIAKFLTK